MINDAKTVAVRGRHKRISRQVHTVTSFSFSTGQSRNAPPEAVSTMRLKPPSGIPWMHWNRAECSESAGRMWTPCFAARGRTAGPPAISVSLLARQMSLPASIAAHVGFRPAQPTIPVTTASISGCDATAHCPSMPTTISGWVGASLIRSFKASTSSPLLIPTSLGSKVLICSANSSMLRPAARATTSNLSENSPQISRVCVPMDPVDPSKEIGYMQEASEARPT